MTLLAAFTASLSDFNTNIDTFFKKRKAYEEKIPTQLLGTIMDEADRFFKAGIKNSLELVDHLKLRDAFLNHGLATPQVPTKLLYAAIQKNPDQFNQAFERHLSISDDRIFELTQNVKFAKLGSDTVLAYAELLLQAEWQDGATVPTDEGQKWVWLTDGLFTYLEKDAKYDLAAGEWQIRHTTSEPYFKVHYWTNINTNK